MPMRMGPIRPTDISVTQHECPASTWRTHDGATGRDVHQLELHRDGVARGSGGEGAQVYRCRACGVSDAVLREEIATAINAATTKEVRP